MEEWQNTKPPNEVWVEVEDPITNEIIVVQAFYGRDGYRPHWRSKDEGTVWSVSTFSRWRHLPPLWARVILESEEAEVGKNPH